MTGHEIMKPLPKKERMIIKAETKNHPKKTNYPRCPYCKCLCADIETMKIHQIDCEARIAKQARREQVTE